MWKKLAGLFLVFMINILIFTKKKLVHENKLYHINKAKTICCGLNCVELLEDLKQYLFIYKGNISLHKSIV